LIGFAPMPPSPIQFVSLTPHPETRSRAVHRIDARISQMPDGTLGVTYILEGDIPGLRIPPAGPARIADELWHHTCFEVFVARKGSPAYHEFNLAPSGEWAVYAFQRYRARAPLDADAADMSPRIAVRADAKTLELDAVIRLDRLSPTHSGARLSLALCAVVEDQDGALSYWALKHPPGKPDFHHSDAFALELDEVRD
jgi:hypothetical protein